MNTVKTKPKVSFEKEELELDKQKCILDKIEEIRHCLQASVIEKSTAWFEQTYAPVFDESETATLKTKFFELLHKL